MRLATLLIAVALLAAACAGQAGPDVAGGATPTTTPDGAGDGLPPREPFFFEPGGDPDAPTAEGVSLDDIRSGGPPPDGIPPIDEPAYETIEQADGWLEDAEPVMVLEVGDAARAYPLRIMTWHEIANDVLGGQQVLVTYCPLCNSGLAFDPTVRGVPLDFGTSGQLWRSNLVMYDRATQTLWSQFTGEAMVGPLLGESLERLPIGLVSWAEFTAAHPDGDVLSRETGHQRPYGENPYVGYDTASSPFLFDGDTDDVLPQMAKVVAIGEDADPVAVPLEPLAEAGLVELELDGRPVVVLHAPGTASALDSRDIAEGRDVGTTGAFLASLEDTGPLAFEAAGEPGLVVDDATGSTWDALGRAVDGPLEGSRLQRIPSDDTFWFVQHAFRPGTRVVAG